MMTPIWNYLFMADRGYGRRCYEQWEVQLVTIYPTDEDIIRALQLNPGIVVTKDEADEYMLHITDQLTGVKIGTLELISKIGGQDSQQERFGCD